jgi:hypothetical protein
MKFKTYEEVYSFILMVNNATPLIPIIKNEPIEVNGEFTLTEDDLKAIEEFYLE